MSIPNVNTGLQIKLGAALSYTALGLNILIGLFYTPWMIRSIGKADYGLYVLAMSVITLFIFDFGLSAAITRFIAGYLAEKRSDKIRDCLGIVYKIYFCLDGIIFLILAGIYFFIPLIYRELTPAELEKFKVVFVIASVFSVVSFPFIPVSGILNAYEKFIQVKACDLAHKLIIVASMSVCLLCGYGLYALVLVNAGAGILTIVLKLFCIRKFTDAKINFGYSNRTERNAILGYSGWVTVIVVAQRCIFNIAPSMLGMLSGTSDIAVFGIAMTLEAYVFTFASALNGMFLPMVSRITASEEKDLLPLMTKIGRIQIFIIGYLILGYFILGRIFIRLWVGPAFDAVYLCAALLILPSFFQLPQEIASTAVAVMNKVKYQAWVFVAMAIINLLFGFAVIPVWGVKGLSLSICIAYLIRTAGMNIIYYWVLNIDIFSFFRNTFVKLLPPLLAAALLGLGFNYLIPGSNWLFFFIKGMLFTAAYACVMYFLGMNQYERDLILKPVRKILTIK